MEAVDTVNAIRQNHALEHATIAVLLPKLNGKVRLVGRAGLSSFHLYGDIPTKLLEESTHEALRRLQEGEKSLAVSPMCGTNLAVAGLAAGIASMIAGRGHSGIDKFGRVIQASVLAVLVAQPLGRLAPKHITTRSDLDNVRIAQVIRKGSGKYTRHKVTLARV
jgi:hypothetical protein